MSLTVKPDPTRAPQQKKSRAPRVRAVEAPRWTSLRGRMTPQQRRQALREVADKMR